MAPSKTQKLLEKGDQLVKKGKSKAALKHYQEAKKHHPECIEIYDRLITTHQKYEAEWTEADFAESLLWSMKKQELEDPKFKRIHAKLEPEWPEITTLIQKMMSALNENEETALVEKIIAFGKRALYPLTDMLLTYKEIARREMKKIKNENK